MRMDTKKLNTETKPDLPPGGDAERILSALNAAVLYLDRRFNRIEARLNRIDKEATDGIRTQHD